MPWEPLQYNSLGEFHLILQTGETLPDSRLLLQMIYISRDLPVHRFNIMKLQLESKINLLHTQKDGDLHRTGACIYRSDTINLNMVNSKFHLI